MITTSDTVDTSVLCRDAACRRSGISCSIEPLVLDARLGIGVELERYRLGMRWPRIECTATGRELTVKVTAKFLNRALAQQDTIELKTRSLERTHPIQRGGHHRLEANRRGELLLDKRVR